MLGTGGALRACYPSYACLRPIGTMTFYLACGFNSSTLLSRMSPYAVVLLIHLLMLLFFVKLFFHALFLCLLLDDARNCEQTVQKHLNPKFANLYDSNFFLSLFCVVLFFVCFFLICLSNWNWN
jgi:hypothetical protein